MSTATPPFFSFFKKRDFIQVRHRVLNSFASPLITILQFEEVERTNVSLIAQDDFRGYFSLL